MLDFRVINEFFKDVLAYIIIVAIIAFVLIFIIAVVPVAGNSMNPNINDGDLTLVVRFAYVFSSVKRGDVINIKTDEKLRYVKRVIGLPNEKVICIKNVIYINGVPLSEEYLGDDVFTSGFTLDDICKENECPDGVIPEDKYLVLGDNREDSFDSRDPDLGLISKNDIQGKVIFKVWPLNEFSNIK